jgi:hypothetical protein
MSRLYGRKQAIGQSGVVVIAVVVITLALTGCGKPSGSSGPLAGMIEQASTAKDSAQDSKKVGDGLKLLMDSIDKPQAGLHFSYQAQENINPKFPSQAGTLPELGAVTLEADVTPDEVTVSENRGGKPTQTKSNKSDPMFGLAKLEVTSSLLKVTIPFAVGSPTAESAGSDAVGGTPADKFNMDTTTANANTRAALDMLGAMFGGKVKIKSVKGSAWLEKSSGRLVKFDLNTDLSTQDGHSWQEHYQAVVTQK